MEAQEGQEGLAAVLVGGGGAATEGPHGARVACPQSVWAPLVSEEKLRRGRATQLGMR